MTVKQIIQYTDFTQTFIVPYYIQRLYEYVFYICTGLPDKPLPFIMTISGLVCQISTKLGLTTKESVK